MCFHFCDSDYSEWQYRQMRCRQHHAGDIIMPDLGNLLGSTIGITIAITVASLIFALVIVVFVIRYSRRMMGRDRASQELLATGAPAQARIVQVQETGMRINDMPVLNFLLEVTPMNGQPPFQVWTRRRVGTYQIMQFQIGSILPVRYDPADPTKVAIAL
jgi:hypothetical protein